MKPQNLIHMLIGIVCIGLLTGSESGRPSAGRRLSRGQHGRGQNALLSLTTGGFNTAVGFLSLRSITSNQFNTAIGAGTLLANAADQNTAIGAGALLSNTIGAENTANGRAALVNNTTGGFNIGLGDAAGQNLTVGDSNIDIGNEGVAGESNTIRIGNVAVQTRTFIAGIRGRTTGNNNAVHSPDRLSWPARHDQLFAPV